MINVMFMVTLVSIEPVIAIFMLICFNTMPKHLISNDGAWQQRAKPIGGCFLLQPPTLL